LAERADGESERIARHLLATEPAGDGWVVERLVEAGRAAGKKGAPESEAVFLRRALAEPASPGDRAPMLLDLGMAEASISHPDWREHLEGAVEAASDSAAAVDATMVLATGLSRAQRFADAVDVLDRASSTLDPRDSELALLLEAAAVAPAMNDRATAPSVALRRERLRGRIAEHRAPPELPLAVAAFTSVLTNEPADVGAELATRALLAGGSELGGTGGGRPWFSFATWFSLTTFALLWTERYAQLQPLLDASIARARATGDSSRLAVGLATHGWLALRRGDLLTAEGDARTAMAAIKLPAPPMYRVMNGGLLVKTLVDRGDLEAAEEALLPLHLDAEGGSVIGAEVRFSRGRLRMAQGRFAEALEDYLAVGTLLTRATIISPGYLCWRSEAALAQLALGDRDSAARLADEELELALAFGAPRTLGVAKRAAGIVAGGHRGELLLREAIDASDLGEAALERTRAQADLGAMIRRRNRRTEARELLREALDAAQRAGAGPLAEYAETELRATGARPRRILLSGLDSLTASERRVAELAGSGLTNREIAQLLFVTARTVEGHLTSVFRKLQLGSREDLPAALETGTQVPA
jgi:DNA-binding CsgD family transcriptional regulator/tetratricopeptide (TPR) repeat protein